MLISTTIIEERLGTSQISLIKIVNGTAHKFSYLTQGFCSLSSFWLWLEGCMRSSLEVLQNFGIRHPVLTSLNKKREFVVSHNEENYWGGSQDQKKNYRAPGPATSGSVQALSDALVDISSSLCLSFLALFCTLAILPPYVTFSFSARRERRAGSGL